MQWILLFMTFADVLVQSGTWRYTLTRRTKQAISRSTRVTSSTWWRPMVIGGRAASDSGREYSREISSGNTKSSQLPPPPPRQSKRLKPVSCSVVPMSIARWVVWIIGLLPRVESAAQQLGKVAVLCHSLPNFCGIRLDLPYFVQIFAWTYPKGRICGFVQEDTLSLGDRSFAVAAPRAWNKLPSPLRRVDSVNTFKRHLKTFLLKHRLFSFSMFSFCILFGALVVFRASTLPQSWLFDSIWYDEYDRQLVGAMVGMFQQTFWL